MKAKKLPGEKYLNECFVYDEESGRLYWRSRPAGHFIIPKTRSQEWLSRNWNNTFAGKEALTCRCKKGYLRGHLDGRPVLSHRVIWKMCYGLEPDIIDHIDGNCSNNRISNLRNVDKRLNGRNYQVYKSNTTGISGVTRGSKHGFHAAVRDLSGKRLSRWFPTLEAAAGWRAKKENEFGYIIREPTP